ncbi:tRNA (adenosine(37)-N6)-threonylcarbamoyltransferase complex dimerization subunit type 1 TsaB [Alphaproteobacteria bacterium LSUCC0719]
MSALPDQAVILALEASADQASAAICRADGQHWQNIHTARHGHAAVITELARDVLDQAGLTAGELTHVAAGRGPGSFTGIRVALAAAKGFALACGADGIGVSCLAAAAHAARADRAELAGRHLLASADTRRGSYFCQLFDPANKPLSSIMDILPEPGMSLPQDWYAAAILGPGAGELIQACPDHDMTVVTDAPAVDALQIAALAAHLLQTGQATEPLTPLYVAPAFLGPASSGPKSPLPASAAIRS